MAEESHIKLTEAQQRGLFQFDTQQWGDAFPAVNPRTAAALWSKHLTEGLYQRGEMTYRLTPEGERVTARLVQIVGANPSGLQT
jgi:hypothetical protein